MITSGRFADVRTEAEKAKINPLGRWYKPWFYKHVETFLQKGQGQEFIALRQYYHRHTRSIFWALEQMIPFGNHPAYRFMLGWLGAPKISLIKLTMTPQMRKEAITSYVVQDIIIPLSELPRSVELFEQWFNVYPLLVYPIRIFDHGKNGFLRPPPNKAAGRNWQMFLDLGVYGVPDKVARGEPWDPVRSIREMESYTRDVGGYQCLYADTFMTRDRADVRSPILPHDARKILRSGGVPRGVAEGQTPTVNGKAIRLARKCVLPALPVVMHSSGEAQSVVGLNSATLGCRRSSHHQTVGKAAIPYFGMICGRPNRSQRAVRMLG